MPRRGRRGRALPRAGAERVRRRRPADAGHAARRRRRGGRRAGRGVGTTCCPCWSSGRRWCTAPASSTARSSSTAGVVLGVAPKSYLPTYREFYERRWFAPGDDRAGVHDHRRRARPCRSARTCSSTRPTCPGLVLHVEICEDMWVPIPPSAEAALAGATVLANLSGSPITVARAEDRRLLVRSASARCSAAYLFAAAGQGESTTDLSLGRPDDGLRVRRPARRDRALPRGRAAQRRGRRPRPDPPGAAPAGHLRRQPAHPRRAGASASAPSPSSSPADRRHRAATQGRPLPVRARRRRPARARLLRGLQHPGLRARAAAARDRAARRS